MIDITESLIRLRHAVKQYDAVDGYDLALLLDLARNQARVGVRQDGWSDGLNRLVRLIEMLLDSPTAESLMVYLTESNLRLKFDHLNNDPTYAIQGEADCIFDAENNIICLAREHLYRSRAFETRLVSLLACQMRRAWQFHQNYFAEISGTRNKTDLVRSFRAEEADSVSIAILIAWELRLAERPQCWRDWIAGSEGDMALAFADAIERKPVSQFDGTALKTAYEVWFSDFNRLSACDERALDMLEVLDTTDREIAPRLLSVNTVLGLDQLPENMPDPSDFDDPENNLSSDSAVTL